MTTQENAIRRGECCLGIELGSTRIKAVAIDEHDIGGLELALVESGCGDGE